MLVLPIKKKWFEMIKSGEKKEEYRGIKPYYNIRLKKYLPVRIKETQEIFLPHFFQVIFRNGYRVNSPKINCRCTLRVGQGKKEWGAEPGKEYYILEILEVCNVK